MAKFPGHCSTWNIKIIIFPLLLLIPKIVPRGTFKKQKKINLLL